MLSSLSQPQTVFELALMLVAALVFLFALAKVEAGESRLLASRALVWIAVLTPVIPVTIDILRGAGATVQVVTVDDSQLSPTALFASHALQILLLIAAALSLRESAARAVRGTTLLFWLVQLLWFVTLLSAISSSWAPKLLGWTLPLVVFALFAAARAGAPVIADLRRAVFALLVSSLAMYILTPTLATDAATRSGSTALRLAGVFSQPNGLGEVAAVGLVLALATTRGVWLVVLSAIACTCIVLADSRTAFAAAAVSVPLVLAAPRRTGSRGRNVLRQLVLAAGSAIAAVLIIQSAVLGSGSDVSSLNGRTLVWDYVRQEWQQQPWLGAGPGGWQSARLLSQVPIYAGQAHNQFFESLYLYGIAGVLALAVLLVVAAVHARIEWSCGSPAPLAIIVCLIVTGFAESPFRMDVSGMSLEGVIALCTLSALQIGRARGGPRGGDNTLTLDGSEGYERVAVG
jgi:O-antigen ligase